MTCCKRICERLPSKKELKGIVQEAFMTGTIELPDNKYIFSLKLIKQIILFIYFVIQLVYPFIILALEQEYHGYNIACSVISFLGLLSQFLDIPDLLKTSKKLFKCCKECHYEKDEEVQLCECCEGDGCQKCSKWLSRITNFISDNLVFPAVICNLIGFINEKTWELKTGLDYFDTGLFALGIFSDLVLVKGKSIWKYFIIRYLIRKIVKLKGRKKTGCCQCCDRYNIAFIYLILREFMHISMFVMVSCKLYADNFAVENDNAEEPEEGKYKIEGSTWFGIIATWYMPTLSFVYFLFINLYVYYRTAYILAKEDDDDSDVSVSCKLQFFSCVRNPFAIALIQMVLFTFYFFNQELTAQDEGVPGALNITWRFFQGLFILCFIIAHIQAVLFYVLCCPWPLPPIIWYCVYYHTELGMPDDDDIIVIDYHKPHENDMKMAEIAS